MPWGRLDDSLYDHPKLDNFPAEEEGAQVLETLGPDDLLRLAGIGLWARAISWCNRYLTDGAVPRRQVAKLGGTLALADALVTAELFEKTATGYQVHDFLAFNDSRADILARRKKDADRKAEWRRKKDGATTPSDGHDGTDSGTSNGDGANVTPSVPPSVTPSVPQGQDEESQAESQGDSRARDVARIPTRPDPSRPTVRETPPPNPPRRRGGRQDGIATTRDGRILPPGGYQYPVERDDPLDDDAPWVEAPAVAS